MADEQTQGPRRLRIDTALNATEKGDPFLLIKVHGVEDFSQPYKYEISMLRELSKPRIDPADLINTIAKIGVRISELKFFQIPIIRTEIDIPGETGHSFVTRFGVFESVTDEGITDENEDFRTYSAVIVPAFKMMDREIVFRVFEKKNVRDIIRDVTHDFPNLAVNQARLDQENSDVFPIMEYCVQFRESSFNFLSRLMAQFGIWYFFEHDFSIGNARMILGRSSRDFKVCQIEQGDLKGRPVDGLVLKKKQPSLLTITQFRRAYTPTQRLVRSGNFNILVPISTIQAKSQIRPDHDLIEPLKSNTKGAAAPPTDSERFRTEVFPADARVQAEAQQDADIRMQNPEGQVFTASGNTRNVSFIVGRKFHVAKRLALPQEPGRPDIVDANRPGNQLTGLDFDPQIPDDSAKRTFLLTHLEFWGAEPFYSKKGFFETVFGQAFDPNDKGPEAFGDLLLGFTSQGLNNYLQNAFPYVMQNAWYPETQFNTSNPNQMVPYILPFTIGGGLAAMTGLLPTLRTAIADLFRSSNIASDYTNSFQAVPLDQENTAQLPPPLSSGWLKPVAHGPHLAVVIGHDGVDDPPQAPKTRKLDGEQPLPDIYADKLGRVRVRFPWDRKADEAPDGQFKRGDNTCWVRVSEGWAGRGFGTQFLPRIGQEVIVDFIDGDPDRPIITGRVYNADHKKTNLPFPGTLGFTREVVPDDLLDAVGLGDHEFRFSGIRTNSIPSRDATGNPLKDRFHLLRLNDERDKEQYLIRSQRRLDITALEKRYESISSDRHLTVGGKCDKKHTIGGDYIAKVYRHYNLHVGDPKFPKESGNRNTKLEQDESLDVSGTVDQIVGGHWTLEVGSNPTAGPAQVTINALGPTGAIVLNALTNITLTVGTSAIVLTPVAISITSPAINLVGPVSGLTPTMKVSPPPAQLPAELPLPALTLLPQEATPADPGDTLTPPKE